MELEVFIPVAAERLRAALDDPARIARALSGLQQEAGAEPVAGRLKVRVGGTTITYRGTLRVTPREDGSYGVDAEATEARGTGTVTLALTLRLTESAEGTTAVFDGTATADGRIAELSSDAVRSAVVRLVRGFGERVGSAPGEGAAGAAGSDENVGSAGSGGPGGPEESDQAAGAAGPEGPAGSDEADGAGETAPPAGSGTGVPPASLDRLVNDDEASGEVTGEVADEVPGEVADEPTGEATGEAADEPTGEATGEVADEATGEGADEAADESAGDLPEGFAEPPVAPSAESPADPLAEPSAQPPAEPSGGPPAEAAHARRTMIGRSAEEVDHAPPRGRYAPVPAPQTIAPANTLRWAAPAAALALASAIVVTRALRKRR
ncbi:SRPBCC family protein [Streptomyces sp. NPDC056716]|uniref:SRPBCC family protein n=1 Tax=unclassified Streptomyces TaxID=2593676 RepID=UPI0036CF2299